MNKKKLISFILILELIFAVALPVGAEKETSKSTEEEISTDEGENEQKPDDEKEESGPAAHSGAALLMEMKGGKILFEKNSNEKVFPASTTKIMTALLTLEAIDSGAIKLSDILTAQTEAIEPITMDHSNMGIRIGEKLSVEQLLFGMMVYSANDAANVLGVKIGGSLDGFVSLMNKRASELGAKNTHFVNPHGYHDNNHYTTAADLAIFAREAMKYEKFREIVSTTVYNIPPTNKYKQERNLPSTNHLITKRQYTQYFYDKAIGIKTGYTGEAGSCLVSAARDNDTELLCIVMNCNNIKTSLDGLYSFSDSKELLEYGFENFKYVEVVKNTDIVTDSKVFLARKNIRVVMTVNKPIGDILPIDYDPDKIVKTVNYTNEKLTAPIKKGDVLGTVTYEYNGEEIGTADIVAMNDVDVDFIKTIIKYLPILLVLIILFIIIMRVRRRKKIREIRRKRFERMRRKK